MLYLYIYIYRCIYTYRYNLDPQFPFYFSLCLPLDALVWGVVAVVNTVES